ncbi:MAG: hypothetical protein C0592_13070 [Marinilabiliales bacterium]|nr:MAG: hypothetical protein C0592_13070 [Marinilabiliales bacterium]
MLENTMTLFILLSVFYYLRSRKGKTFLYIIFSGLFLSAAVLTKGFVALYIWAFPFFFLVFNKDKFSKILMQSFALVFYTSAPIALFYFFNEEAATNIIYYFRNQVQGSIENVETVNSRFAILWEFVQQALPILFIAAIGILGVKLKKHKISDKPEKISWVLLAITFSGILPIMISMKQRGFYIVSVYPLFALAIALIMLPYFKVQMAGIQKKRYFRRWIQIISVISIIAAIFLSIISAHTIQKDKEKILIVAITSKLTSKGSTIQICPEMRQDWSLNAYFVRYANIYLDPREESDHFLFLTDDSCTESIPHGYVISDGTGKYKLYRKTTE